MTSHCAGCPVQPLAAHVRLDRVRHEVAHRQSGGDATPDEGAGDVDPWHVEEAKAAIGAAQPGQLRGDVRAGEVLALRDAQVRELEHGLRLAPPGEPGRLVGAGDEGQVVLGSSVMERPQGIDRIGPASALDLRGVLGYTDFFVVCSGNTDRQTKAIHDGIHLGLKKEHGILPRRVEGLNEARWILMDYLDVIVHIFTPDARAFYRLEQLWGEAPRRAIAG